MSEAHNKQPFKFLGTRLKTLRQKLQESLKDVSGAVEIETEKLERFEHGFERPSEDILMLLISHFGMHDDEAVTLWELAGYDSTNRPSNIVADDTFPNKQPVVMMLALDTRIVYSDGISIVANPNGVVLNFTQIANPDNQQAPIARVGMSREQAENVVRMLSQTLRQVKRTATTKSLPVPKNRKNKDSSTNK